MMISSRRISDKKKGWTELALGAVAPAQLASIFKLMQVFAIGCVQHVKGDY